MYRTWGNFPIKKFKVVKKTAKQVVFINERGIEQREALTSDWNTWHDTLAELKAHLVSVQKQRIEALKKQIQDCESRLLEIDKIQEP